MYFQQVERSHQLDNISYLNEQILLNALPTHIAYSYNMRNDPYGHYCQSVGVLVAKLGRIDDWKGEFGFDRLNRIVYEIDQLLCEPDFKSVEKIRTSHCVYTAAVGVLPEVAENVSH